MFPLSDHSSDIIRALEQQMKKAGVKIHLGSRVKTASCGKKKRTQMQRSPESSWITEKRSGANRYWLPLAVNSYPSTGSTGDGYRMAKREWSYRNGSAAVAGAAGDG